jgi:two-component sensor histidine kinase
MKSIFLNLVTNSIKYAKADSPPDDIQSKVTDGIHQLIFSDQGLGFDLDKE